MKPHVAPGELQTNAYINVTARDRPPHESVHSDWFKLEDISNGGKPHQGGPNMGYGTHSWGGAITDASFKTEHEEDTIGQYVLTLKHKIGGVCGEDGTNTGGGGRLAPVWKSYAALPSGGTWNIDITANASTSAPIAGYPTVGDLGQCTLAVIRNGVSVGTLSFARNSQNQTLNLTGLAPGFLDLRLECSGLQQGCLGAPQGTHRIGHATVDIRLRIYQQ